MTLLNEEAIRKLASFPAGERPVVSLYLDVDGRRWPRAGDVENRLRRMIAAQESKLSQETTGADRRAALEDLRRVEAGVLDDLDRSRTRGVAVFASGENLWEHFALPVRVKDHVVVNACPHIRQLEGVVDNYPGFGMLLVDKQRARMFVFELNRLVDKSAVFDPLPRHDDEAGDRDRGQRSHLETATHSHLRRAADLAFETWKQHPFDHFILAAGPEVAHEIEADLHSYLKDRIAARVHLAANAPEPAIIAAALDLEEGLERQREAQMVSRLREAAGSGRGGVVGIDPVLAALAERRVDTLVVSEGYEAEGWRCPACSGLASRGRTCASCGTSMDHVDDVVEEAVEAALLQSCHVEICVGNADLDVAGRVGAVLRF